MSATPSIDTILNAQLSQDEIERFYRVLTENTATIVLVGKDMTGKTLMATTIAARYPKIVHIEDSKEDHPFIEFAQYDRWLVLEWSKGYITEELIYEKTPGIFVTSDDHLQFPPSWEVFRFDHRLNHIDVELAESVVRERDAFHTAILPTTDRPHTNI